MSRIYLDNAATSWPKPEGVYAAVDHYLRELGAPAGRSVYREATETSQAVEGCRQAIARMLGVREARRIVFTLNGTDALNLATHGLLCAGEHVVTSVAEHNSVLRPLRHLEDAGQIQVTRVACDAEGLVRPEAIAAALERNTRLIVLAQASNVTGALQPLEEIGQLAKARGILFLVDAAQSLGHLPVDVENLSCDLLAAPGHKGLLGPLGTGILYVGEAAAERLQSVRQGGTGSKSEDDHQPQQLPDKFEAGSLNVPGIIGLGAGVRYLQEQGLNSIRQHEMELTGLLRERLAGLPNVDVYGPQDPTRRVGVVSFTVEGFDPQEIASLLDSSFQIQVRSGIHCAPLMHQTLGTGRLGAVRISLGPFNTASEIETAAEAVSQIAAMPSLS